MSANPIDLFPLDGLPSNHLPADKVPDAALERWPFAANEPSFDIFVTTIFGDPDFILWNDNNGGFVYGDVPSDEIWGSANDVVLGDLNSDGLLDAFVITENHESLVLLNNGDETFTVSGAGDLALQSRGVDLGDIDADGDLDVFVANQNGFSQILVNDGSGNFTPEIYTSGATLAQDVEFGDLDGDGDLDALVARFFTQNQILLNDGSGNFTTQTIWSSGSAPTVAFALGDLDGDGDLDAFAANFPGVDQFYFNDGGGGFSVILAPDGYSNSQAAELGDLDGDGDLDVMVVGGDDYGLQEMRILLNDGFGNFSASPSSLDLPDVGTDVALADIDGDGDLDAYVTHFNTNDSLLINNGAGQFTSLPVSGTDLISSGVAIGDLNGDGGIALPDPSLTDVFEFV